MFNNTNPKILIVDDEPENIRILAKLLKDRCKLMVAVNGAEALELAASDPDLILLDIMMPGLDGYEVCRRLKDDEKTCGIPVIFITARGEAEDETRGFELGAVDYITKPFNPAVVEARVNTHLELKQYRASLEDRARARTLDFAASESRLGSVINAFRGFIYTCRENRFHIDFMNRALMERTGGGKVGKCCHEIIFGLEVPCDWCPVDKVCDGKTVETEIENPKDGRWYHGVWSPVFADDGSIARRQAILIDITKRKLREIELRESEENLRRENLRLKMSVKDRYRFGEIVGKSRLMQEVYEKILKAGEVDAGVIIYGESGTGKELIARAIHRQSERRDGELVSVNCGAIPESLLETEFFGHGKGAFTGADQDKPGLLEIADGGTLFLDEIAEIGLTVQVKLLRAIEGAGFNPLGSARLVTPDIRIIAATNKDLKDLVGKGAMREDFFFRIHVIPIYMPPLRKRREDIPLLVEHFLDTCDLDDRPPIPASIMDNLLNHDWPGNVRELENTLHRYVTLNKLDLLGTDPADALIETPTENKSLPDILERIERKLIIDGLEQNRWRRDKTARELGINRKALYRKMKLYGLLE